MNTYFKEMSYLYLAISRDYLRSPKKTLVRTTGIGNPQNEVIPDTSCVERFKLE